MTVLLLVRHGMTSVTGSKLTGWAPGFHLSEEGRVQAERVGERLVELPLRAIYCSPLERCRETAEPLARRTRLSVRVRPRLGEVRYGDWTGRSLAQLRRTKLWRRVQLTPSNVRFPGGESFLEVQERAVDEVLRISESHPDAAVAAVSHADVIKLVLAHFAGMHQDAFQRLVVDPGSVSVLSIADGFARVVTMNNTGDLAHLVPRTGRARAAKPAVHRGRPSGRQVRG
ncbi:MAG TPA: MSMEG_4193 family putative phosphomutase [Actinomycetota bacterium]|nr:MSMEG_4193 family putative phosphomutase [Actinomycetota bacterium]